MQKTVILRLLSLLFVLVMFVGCSNNQQYADESVSSAISSTATEYPKQNVKLGQGKYTFNLIINHPERMMKTYIIKTDKKIVGEALVDLGLITMGNDDYGLHIKTVDGITLDAEKDGKVWFLFIDANQAAAAMQTEVSAAEQYFLLQPQ